ncbi:class I SAM-dependent methyltransferase [Streptomyces sp. LRE541]|uniref:class I SAM-dependent methyltransferase n=1 Tax=Streptomyces sp. LRE541 TaxID=2931983 RepID=UPI00200DB91A|nr:class I SAM-dependent methyltransferase [Streptomyces sp. LRE541]UPZ33451.1 class I SAM-dependent methyltransferase [Streptomyces sp. LRE541]
MDQGERLLHSSSFGAAAVAYAEHRPDYARAAVRWALAPAAGPRVLDLGAGTGKLTATLLALSADTVAVEPDPAMLAELRRSLPEVRALPGSAEAIPLPDGSVDAVLAGNALHWFDMAVAGPEIARVLVPGGILAGLWNVMNDEVGGSGGVGEADGSGGADEAGGADGTGGSCGSDRVGGAEWVSGLARVGGSAAVGPRDTPVGWRAETADAYLPETGGAARFGSPERAEFPHGQRRTADSLVAALATRAGMLVMPEPERRATLARIRGYLASRPETARGEFTLPMLTAVLRVRRL